MNNERNIGKNRGKPRLWLEGAILIKHGFNHGDKWTATKNNDQTLTLWRNDEGNRRIAGTVDRPIIDINNAQLLARLEPRVRIEELVKGMLVVSPA